MFVRRFLLSTVLLGISSLAHANLPLQLPGPTVRIQTNSPRLEAIKIKNAKYPTFAAFREMADIYISLGRFAEAAQTLRAQAAMYRQKNLIDAAIIQETRAARYETQVRFFVDRPLRDDEWKAQHTRATLEPPVGSYLGAFIDRDDQLPTKWMDENFQTHREPTEFNKAVGKAHGSYFMYLSYGNKFPKQWLENCKKNGAIPHLAWEPKKLSDVRDDKYLQEFAKQAAALNWPIFLRYASEMNGKWTPYNGNPTLYREKFRLVHKVFKKFAPQVATVWCVNSVPREGIPAYYPGDDGCDWVGINVYSVPFYDNNPKNPALLDSPLALIDPVYELFKNRKPMAICEYAASHMASTDRKLRLDFAIEKMSLLYSALPRLYPRIKMVNWFNMNTMKHAAPGRQLNNYSLTENIKVLGAYRDLVNNEYFIGASLVNGKAPKKFGYGVPYAVPRPLLLGQTVSGEAKLSLWVKSYVARPKVYLTVGDRIIYADAKPGAHALTINTRSLPVGNHRVTAHIFDDQNRWISSAVTSLRVSRSAASRGGSLPSEPLPISGRVKGFLADELGLVNAVEIDGGDQVLGVRFPAAQAAQIMELLPLGAQVELTVQARGTLAADGWDLRAIGTQTVAVETSPLQFAIGETPAEPIAVRDQLVQVLAGANGRALVLDNGDVLHLPAPSAEAGTDVLPAPVWKRGALVEATVKPLALPTGAVSDVANRWIIQTLSLDGNAVNVAASAPPTDAMTKFAPRAYVFPLRMTRGESTLVAPLVEANKNKRPW